MPRPDGRRTSLNKVRVSVRGADARARGEAVEARGDVEARCVPDPQRPGPQRRRRAAVRRGYRPRRSRSSATRPRARAVDGPRPAASSNAPRPEGRGRARVAHEGAWGRRVADARRGRDDRCLPASSAPRTWTRWTPRRGSSSGARSWWATTRVACVHLPRRRGRWPTTLRRSRTGPPRTRARAASPAVQPAGHPAQWLQLPHNRGGEDRGLLRQQARRAVAPSATSSSRAAQAPRVRGRVLLRVAQGRRSWTSSGGVCRKMALQLTRTPAGAAAAPTTR